VSASVGERTREIGVRIALGAESPRVLRDVLRDAVRLTAAGASIGFVAGYLTASAMRSWLFQLGPFDGTSYLLVAAIIAFLAIASAWIPARRAASIDPVQALR
jgi:ABC-type antimicrobial peptide transport system permease subunit